MKKIGFLISFLACSLLLTGCDSYNNLTTYQQQTAGCEKWILSHGVEKADFERKGSEKIGDKIVITGIQYGYDGRANQEVSCEFNENGKLLGIKSSNLRNYETNNSGNVINMGENIVPGGYLYRNLDLDNEEDKLEYEAIQNDRNMILKYQTDTSAAVNKFIDVIHDDLLDYCQEYGTNYETMKGTMYERDVCVDNYIKDLYEKLRVNLILPQKDYSGDDPVLTSYYNDLKGDHPFVRYFVDLYTEIIDGVGLYGMPEYPIKAPLSENPDGGYWGDEEKGRELYSKNKTGFYTYGEGNITRIEHGDYISIIASGIVFNGSMLEWIQNEYGYTFPYYTDAILQGSSPERGPIVLHQNNGYVDYIYQIISEGGGSGEFYLLVWVLKDGLWIPIGYCGYMLFPSYPMLFGECKERTQFDSLTIFTQEYNFYEGNSIEDMADNFTFFLKSLESIRILSK